jgi:hypothetical protein
MSADREFEVDGARPESLTLTARASLGNGPRRFASQFLRSWLLLLAVVFILPALADGHLPVQSDFAGRKLTLGVGMPVGLLAAFLAPANALPSGGRLVVLPMFVGMTALWAIPMGFVIRWLTVRSLRRVMRPVAWSGMT